MDAQWWDEVAYRRRILRERDLSCRTLFRVIFFDHHDDPRIALPPGACSWLRLPWRSTRFGSLRYRPLRPYWRAAAVASSAARFSPPPCSPLPRISARPGSARQRPSALGCAAQPTRSPGFGPPAWPWLDHPSEKVLFTVLPSRWFRGSPLQHRCLFAKTGTFEKYVVDALRGLMSIDTAWEASPYNNDMQPTCRLPMPIRSMYGRIVDIDLKIPPKPPGYGFVEFEDPHDAEDAVAGWDGYNFDRHRLRVEPAHGGRGHGSSNDRSSSFGGGGRRGVSRHLEYRVLVTGLPSSASWQDLKDHMRRAGEVCFSEVYREGSGTIGIVDYTNYDDMKYAIKKLNDSEFKNAFSRGVIRVKEYDGKRARSYSRSRSPSRSRSKSRSLSKSPRDRRSASRSRSRSVSSHSRSASKGRSPSRMKLPGYQRLSTAVT